MLRKPGWMAVTALIALAASGPDAAGDHRQIPLISIHSETQIAGSPAAVWTYITTGKNFATWCPSWRGARNAKMNITRVGDVLDYADAWGNGGRSVVTYAVQTRELRVAHEPNKGDYLCQGKIQLTVAAGGTHVDFWDQYSDSSATKDMEATIQKMQLAADSSLMAIKKGVETKPDSAVAPASVANPTPVIPSPPVAKPATKPAATKPAATKPTH